MRSMPVAGLVGLLTTAACQRGPDVQRLAGGTMDSVALDDAVDVEYDEEAHLIRLSGTVTSPAERARAEQAERASVGEFAHFANEVVVAGLNAEVADDFDSAIHERLETMVKNAPDLEGADIAYRVANGVVTITGTVADESRGAAIEISARFPTSRTS